MKNTDIQKLAERHGLMLSDKMKFNEMGIDFKVGFANTGFLFPFLSLQVHLYT